MSDYAVNRCDIGVRSWNSKVRDRGKVITLDGKVGCCDCHARSINMPVSQCSRERVKRQ